MTASDASPWVPRSWRERAEGLVWLPRMLDKARRRLEGERAGRDAGEAGDVMAGYFFGDNDYVDKQLLAFLRADGRAVLDLLRTTTDDAAARELVRRSGRTPAECAAWNAAFARRNRAWLAMFEADEGRRAPGLGTTLLRGLYNALVPLFDWSYRRAESRRTQPG